MLRSWRLRSLLDLHRALLTSWTKHKFRNDLIPFHVLISFNRFVILWSWNQIGYFYLPGSCTNGPDSFWEIYLDTRLIPYASLTRCVVIIWPRRLLAKLEAFRPISYGTPRSVSLNGVTFPIAHRFMWTVSIWTGHISLPLPQSSNLFTDGGPWLPFKVAYPIGVIAARTRQDKLGFKLKSVKLLCNRVLSSANGPPRWVLGRPWRNILGYFGTDQRVPFAFGLHHWIGPLRKNWFNVVGARAWQVAFF
jgi:hypothetical protein